MSIDSHKWFSIDLGRERAERCKKDGDMFMTTPEHFLFITKELKEAHYKLRKIKELTEDG